MRGRVQLSDLGGAEVSIPYYFGLLQLLLTRVSQLVVMVDRIV